MASPRKELRPRVAFANARQQLRRVPVELAALAGTAAVLALAWAVFVVPLQGPDEATHVSYAQQLAETGHGPYPDRGEGPVSTEIGIALDEFTLGALIGVRSARPARTELEQRLWEKRMRTVTDDQRRNGTGPSPLARNPQLYYAYQAVPYLAFSDRDLFDRMIAMRLANALLFVVTVVLTWLLATELFGRAARVKVVVATAIVALWPMLTFMAGVVNPDTALVTAYTATMLLAVRLLQRGPTLGRVAALCLGAAVCLLVHGRGLAAVGVVAMALIGSFVRYRPPVRRLGAWTTAGAVAAVVPLVLSKLVLAPGTGGGLYGGEASIPTEEFRLKQLASQIWQFYLDRLTFMEPRLGPEYGYRQVVVERFLAGVFGSLEITYPGWVYDLVQYGVVLLVVAMWTALIVRRSRLRVHWPLLITLVALPVGLMLLLQTASYRALLFGGDPLITGRYLLPLAPLVAVAVAWSVGTLPRRPRLWGASAVIVFMLLMQFGALGLTVTRFHV